MKKVWYQHKKLIVGAMSIVLIVSILACQILQGQRDAQAAYLLKDMQTFVTGLTEVRIVEIVPEKTQNYEELGVFVSNGDKDFIADASKSTYFKQQFRTDLTVTDKKEQLDHYLEMRMYGLINSNGNEPDYSGDITDYPFYGAWNGDVMPLIRQSKTVDGTGVEANVDPKYMFARGNYTRVQKDVTDIPHYKLQEGYTLVDGYIYKTDDATPEGSGEEPESDDTDNDDDDDSVSGNSVSGNSVSGNEADAPETISVSANSFDETIALDDDTAVFDMNGDDPAPQDSSEDDGDVRTSDDENGVTGYQSVTNYGNYELPQYGTATLVEPDLSAKYFIGGYQFDGTKRYCPLPEGIEYVTDGGELYFYEETDGKYWGYATQPYVYSLAANGNMKYYNTDWFRSAVLGDRNSTINVNIKQIKASEVTAANIKDAHLIYLSGTAEAFAAKGDLSAAAAAAIYNATVSSESHTGVIMDYDAYKEGGNSNIDKLFWMLLQKDQTAIAQNENYKSLFDDTTYTITEDASTVLGNSALMADLKASMLETYEGNLVTGNVYVYDHRMSLFTQTKAMVDCHDFFANGDFRSQYTLAASVGAFNQVVAEVKNHNILNPDKVIPENVTPAIIVQYIMSAKHFPTNLIKSEINILEIQPTPDFLFNANNYESEEFDYITNEAIKNNRKVFIEKYIDERWTKDGKQNFVSFTSMTVSEFNCKNESLFENYDLVYIGSQIGASSLNGDKKGFNVRTGTSHILKDNTDDVNALITNFEDNNMDGMVYYNIGDLVELGNRSDFAKILSDENGKFVKTRYTGNDLTTDKLDELKTYLQSGHPIVVAGDLMCSDEYGVKKINPTAHLTDCNIANDIADHGRIDNSSNMYELFQFANGYTFDYDKREYVSGNQVPQISGNGIGTTGYRNFISEADVDNGWVTRETIAEYLNAPQLYLEVSKQPLEYTYSLVNDVIDTSTIVYINKDANGKFSEDVDLEYEFAISGVSTTAATDGYTVKLFVDVNADGRFSDDEECSDAMIVDKLTGQEAEVTADGAEMVYNLEEGKTYSLTRAVPTGYVGIIPWCLRVEKIGEPTIQATHKGYSAVGGEKKRIKILQLIKDSEKGKDGFDLQKAQKDTSKGFGKYLANVPDYDVYVNTIKLNAEFCDEYVKYYADATHKEAIAKDGAMAYFNNRVMTDANGVALKEPDDATLNDLGVDMLVLGFGDDYPGVNNQDALNGIKAFIDSGKPVLLAHDFIMFTNNATAQDATMRDLVGMDRYGVKTGNAQLLQAAKTTTGTNGGHGSFAWNEDSAVTVSGNTLTVAEAVEGKNRAVAYEPGSGRKMFSAATQGNTYSMINWFKKSPTNMYYMASIPWHNFDGNYAISMYVDQENDGMLTEYPYHIPRSFMISKTHGQYFALDQETDADNDGLADTVVWYTLGYKNGNSRGVDGSSSVYTASPGNGADNYFIYNRGNVTYTGAGHGAITSANEQKLFVNTLLAAYKAADTAPIVRFYETADTTMSPIETIPIPYDSNITKPVKEDGTAYAANEYDKKGVTKALDSSIRWNEDKGDYDYKFVNPNSKQNADAGTIADKDKTPLYFKITDTDFKKGQKRISIKFYVEMLELLSADGKTEYVPGYIKDEHGIISYKQVTQKDSATGAESEARESRNSADIVYYNKNSKGQQGDSVTSYTLDSLVNAGAKNSLGALKDLTKITVGGSTHYVKELEFDVYKVNREKQSDGTYKYSIGDKLNNLQEIVDAKGNTTTASEILNGETYAIYLPLSYLNNNGSFNIYLEAQTCISNLSMSGTTKTEVKEVKGFGDIDVTKVDLLKLD